VKPNKLKMLAILLIIAAATFIFTACGKKAEVVAIVNGEEIKSAMLEERLVKYVKTMEAQGYSFEGEEGEKQRNEFRKYLLSEMIEHALIKQAAKAEGITLEPGMVDDEIKAIKESMGEENFKKALEESFLTEKDVKEMVEQQLIMEKLFNHVTRDVTAEEGALREFYEENKQYLISMKVSHILIEAREETATAEEKQAAKEKAQGLIARLNAGEDFAELARQYSDDPGTAKDGGKMEYYFTENDVNLDPKFTRGSYELSVGNYSQEPVESSFGYHIILAEDKKETFEQLREEIEGYILHDEKNAVFNEYFAKVYEEAEIVNYLIEKEMENNKQQ